MPSSSNTPTKELCAKCFAIPRHGRPLTPCRDCNRKFHVKCLNKIKSNSENIHLCHGCKQKRVSASERDKNNNKRHSSNIARVSSAATTARTHTRSSITSVAPASLPTPLDMDAGRVTSVQASSPVCQNIGPLSDSTHPQTSCSSTNSAINVSNTVTTHLRNNNSPNSAFVTIDSLHAILDTKFNELFNKLTSQPAGDASLLNIISSKTVSVEGQMNHQSSLLGNLVLELHELRRQNAELSKQLINSRTQVTRCDLCNNRNNNSSIDSELGCNPIPTPLPSTDPLPSPPLAPIPSQTLALVEGTEVVNNGELIITNFIDDDITDYKKVAFTVLAALVPSITISDVNLARPLSLPPPPHVKQLNQSRGRIAVLLSSVSLVNRVLLARSEKTRFSTSDLDISLLGSELSKRVRHCKIFINEALCKEKFKLFCTLKSAAKDLGIAYVWHRGGKFMARVRRRDRVHVFESLADLHAIRSASRSTKSQPLQPDALRATEASIPRAELRNIH